MRTISPSRLSTSPLAPEPRVWLWPVLGVAALGLLALGAHLAEEVIEGDAFGLDRTILLALRQPHNLAHPIGPGWMLQSAQDVSALGGFTVMTLIGVAGVAFLVLVRRRGEAAWLAASLLGATLLSTTLKALIGRARPEIVPHLARVTDASFPSGHSMISAAVYLTLGVMIAEAQTRAGVRAYVLALFSVLALLIGFSRLYLGVHWPSDVAAGWCFGALWALVVFSTNRLRRQRTAGR